MIDTKPNYIIFGASGDLSRRYLLPAAQRLKDLGKIGEVISVSRKDYDNLDKLITKGNKKIIHLAVPPEAVSDVVKIISDNLDKENIKILLEKPFGSDLKSAENLVAHIDKYFSEDQIYRVDHYLAKKSMQKIVQEKWSKDNVLSIEVIASEKIGIEGRVNFYEQTGALKDFVQSHMLQMLAVVLAQSFETTQRHKALANLGIVCDVKDHGCVMRGQYEGYRKEVNNEASMTETFVSINLVSNDPVWRGVALSLTTGKALDKKLTQIKIKYKDGSEKIFEIEHETDAYERVIEATIEGDHNLFISSPELLDSWRILDSIQQTWKNSKDDLVIYKKGSSAEEVIKVKV